MKNYQISPGQIPHLVRLTADLFREMREETKSPNNNPINKLEEKNQMHFVADLLKDLVDTAYPIKEETIKSIKIEDEIIKELDKEFEKLAEIARHFVPPTLYPEAFKGGDTEWKSSE